MRITIGLALLALLVGQNPSATIHSSYDDTIKSTEIRTNWLYVLNAPDQFLQLKFDARFSGKQMPKTGPTVFEIQVISQALQHRYADLPELVAIADGVEIKIGKMAQHPIQAIMGMLRGGKKESESMVNDTLSPVPPSAAVLAQHKASDLVGEWIVTKISLDQLKTLAKASKIDWKLGTTTFSFIEIQMTRLRQFVDATSKDSVVVAADTVSEEQNARPLRTDTPSEANNTSLKETLAWLKQQLTMNAGETFDLGEARTLSLSKFNGCYVEWHLSPKATRVETPGITRRLPAMTLTYIAELKDLDPQSVRVSRSGDNLQFFTRNHSKSIKLTFTDDSTGQVNGFMTQTVDSASFILKRNDTGGEMREALSHAIKLCQSGHTK